MYSNTNNFYSFKVFDDVTIEKDDVALINDLLKSPSDKKFNGNTLIEIAHKHSSYVIEDCAVSLGSKYNGKFPITDNIYKCGLNLPSGPDISDADIDCVINTIRAEIP